MKNTLRKSAIALAIVTTLGLTGCFDATTQSTSLETTSVNKTTTGVITGFGSVFINGVEYETANSAVNIDGVANTKGDDSGLKLGMVVTLSGDATGGTGNAVSISFNDEVEGMVTAVPVTDSAGVVTGDLKVMGLIIKTDEDTVFENAATSASTNIVSLADIQIDNIVEVSGYSAGDGTVWATRIELKKEAREAGDAVELKGVISGYDDTVTPNTFMIGEMTLSVTAEMLTANEVGVLADGMLIETKSDVGLDANGIMIVTDVELKSERKKGFDTDGDDDEVEVEGVITAGVVNGAFDVNGSTVNFDATTRFVHGSESIIKLGLKIKVKGAVDANGDFLAETIVFKPTGDIKMAGPISAADATANTITLFGLTINLVNNTLVKDDSEVMGRERVKYLFGADDLAAGDWVKIKAYKNSNGELVANKMTRKTVDAGEPAILKGKVDLLDASLVSGVAVDFSSSSLSPAAGERVELEGTYDAALNKFIATSGETSEVEDNYIGGEDGEENKEDERSEEMEDMDTDSTPDSDTSSNEMNGSSSTM